MSEFCLDCWNKINETNDPPSRYILSWNLDLCEECGEWKRVILVERFGSVAQRELRDVLDRLIHSRRGHK